MEIVFASPSAGADPRAGHHTGKRIRGMRDFCGKQIGVNQLVGNEGLVITGYKKSV